MTTVPRNGVDTDQVAPNQRLSFWREAIADTHEVLLPEDCDPNRFSASALGWHLGNALMVETRATPQRLVRSPRMARTDYIDYYIIRLQKAGRWICDAGGRSVAAGPGSVLVLDLARPSDARMTDIENSNLLLPRDALDDVLPPFDMHGLELRSGMAALLRSHLSELAANLPQLQFADARRVGDATLHLVAACIAPSRDAVARARAPLEAALLAEIRRYVDRHLNSPDLSPHSIAEALGLSRSALYAVCEPMGGVAAFIQKRRLRRIHAILTDPRERRRIGEIAYQFGFTSGAHFSRAFRRAFGYSPSEARDAGTADAAHAPGAGDAAATAGTAYQTWLRQLGG
jgi:AraC-like DNA-binding protein